MMTPQASAAEMRRAAGRALDIALTDARNALTDARNALADADGASEDSSDESVREYVFAAATSIIALGEAMGRPDITRAARLLCDELNRSVETGLYRRDVVRLHVDAMTVLRRGPAEQDAQTLLKALEALARQA